MTPMELAERRLSDRAHAEADKARQDLLDAALTLLLHRPGRMRLWVAQIERVRSQHP